MSTHDMNTHLAALWVQFEGMIQARVGVLIEAVTALRQGDLDLELRRRAEREAHKLAGALGTFGLPRGSDLAQDIERTLRGEGTINAEATSALAGQVEDLETQVQNGPKF